MRLSSLLLFCAFMLCCTGVLRRTCKRLGIAPGSLAAASVLLLAASQFSIKLPAAPLDIAALLALAAAVALAIRTPRAGFCVPAAMIAGLFSWLLCTAFPSAYEPGALIALPVALMAWGLFRSPRLGLLTAMLAPLCYGAIVAIEDWYLFDSALLSVGDPTRFDAQICSAALLTLLWYVPRPSELVRHAQQKTS